jgi:hypothetical protein
LGHRWQTERHTAEPLPPEPNAYKFQIAVEKLIGYECIDLIPAELIQAGGKNFMF